MLFPKKDIENYRLRRLKGFVKKIEQKSFWINTNHPVPRKELFEKNLQSFDLQGKLLSQNCVCYLNKDDLTFVSGYKYVYDNDNILRESFAFNIKNVILHKNIYNYTSDNITEIRQYYGNANKLKRLIIISSDKYLFRETEEEYSTQFKLIKKCERQYDKHFNNIIHERKFDSRNNLIYSLNEKKDIFGRTMSTTIDDKGEYLEFFHKYFGTKKEYVRFFQNGMLSQKWWRWYNQYFDIIKYKTVIENYNRVENIHFKRDTFGNWVERFSESKSNKSAAICQYMVIRKIEYFQ